MHGSMEEFWKVPGIMLSAIKLLLRHVGLLLLLPHLLLLVHHVGIVAITLLPGPQAEVECGTSPVADCDTCKALPKTPGLAQSLFHGRKSKIT